ncbi:transposase [Ferrimicrobium sp.]|uniref:IS66 family transposase n=1 Tax=Ferrimicrobium sp. TaxID=2926050 RepID=UPI0026038A04|nr:transposase [Ferrimicrobium sp.]
MLVAPVPAKPIPKGMFTSQFLARLAVEKYVLGRPLERIVAALLNDGFDVAKGTLVGALKALSELLGPLNTAIRERNSQAAHLHIDETSQKVFEAVADKVGNRWWLWTFLGPDTVVFLIDPTRSTRVVAQGSGKVLI